MINNIGAAELAEHFALGGHEFVSAASARAAELGLVAHIGAAVTEYAGADGDPTESPRMVAVFTEPGENPVDKYKRLSRHPQILALMFGHPRSSEEQLPESVHGQEAA